jgi:hypothetical protein
LWPVNEPLRTRELAGRAEQAIAAGQVQIDALELAALMRERTLALEILDLRDEDSFQRFHLRDARRVEGDVVEAARGPRKNVVRVLVAADEAPALDAYRALARPGRECLRARRRAAGLESPSSRRTRPRRASARAAICTRSAVPRACPPAPPPPPSSPRSSVSTAAPGGPAAAAAAEGGRAGSGPLLRRRGVTAPAP